MWEHSIPSAATAAKGKGWCSTPGRVALGPVAAKAVRDSGYFRPAAKIAAMAAIAAAAAAARGSCEAAAKGAWSG